MLYKLSLKELLCRFTHVPYGFPEYSEREYPGGVDAFHFNHISALRGDGRGLASACACEDRVGGLGLID